MTQKQNEKQPPWPKLYWGLAILHLLFILCLLGFQTIFNA